MTDKTIIYTGEDIIQSQMPIVDYISSEQDNCKFAPQQDKTTPNTATFTNTHQPIESNDVDWKKVELNWTRQQIDDPDSDDDGSFTNKVSLYGIMHDGEPELIGEHITTSIPSTSATESIIFDLTGSAGEPPLTKSSNTTTTGKIRLNLPMTLKNYESLTLKHSPYEPEWTKVRLLPITGINGYSATNYVIGPIDITYDSDMNNDFSDLRYAIWDGTQFIDCRYYIFSKTDGVTARVFVEIPSLPESPTINYVYRFYGNPIATTTSDPTVLYLFDDFENGQYTNWNVVGGTGSIISTGQIGGTYSFKHQGANTGEGIPVYNSSRLTGLNYVIIDFDFKLLTQGSGSSDPFIGIWYIQYVDSSNFLRLETSWDGTNQYFKLRKMVGGTTTVLSTYTKDAAKYPANETHHFKILYNGSSVTVFVDSNKIINNVVVGSTFSSTRMGMGCLQSASGAWDNIKIRRNLPNFTPIGLEPTLGTLTGESTNISPDSWDDTLQYLLFTLTSDYIANCPICFDVVELDADTYETPDVIGNSGNIFQLGFDHVAKYHALRVVVETDSEKTNLITWNWIKYGYSL